MMEEKHVIKYTHRDGKKLAVPIMWCDKEIDTNMEWCFLDAQHVALSVGGSNQPCKKCISAIIKTLEKEL